MSLTVTLQEVNGVKANKGVYFRLRFRDQEASTKPKDVDSKWVIKEAVEFDVPDKLITRDIIYIDLLKKGFFGSGLVASCKIQEFQFRRQSHLQLDLTKDSKVKCQLTCDVVYAYSSEEFEQIRMPSSPKDRSTIIDVFPDPIASTSQVLDQVKEEAAKPKVEIDTLPARGVSKKKSHPPVEPLKTKIIRKEKWQVHVSVIEGRELVGVDIEPVVRLTLDDESVQTTARIKENNPQWGKDFGFRPKQKIKEQFLDEILTVQAISKGDLIGVFKIDMWHVYEQPGHCYNGKWAVLTDETGIAMKGSVKLSIWIKTEKTNFLVRSKREDSGFERNLMLPPGVNAARRVVNYNLHIHEGFGLPPPEGVLQKDLYVKVSFAGHEEKTEVTREKDGKAKIGKTFTFTDFYPAMFRRMKITVEYSNITSRDIVATHFLDLSHVSELNTKVSEGFPPTFGPSWIHLYGHWSEEHLNKGYGGEVTYRGRLLVSLDCEESMGDKIGNVQVQNLRQGDEARGMDSLTKFCVYASVYQASMMHKAFSDDMWFKLTLGEFGTVSSADKVSHGEKDQMCSLKMKCKKGKEQGLDFLKIEHRKPGMSIDCLMDDQRGRLAQRVMMDNILYSLEAALRVNTNAESRTTNSEEINKSLKDLREKCKRYLHISSYGHRRRSSRESVLSRIEESDHEESSSEGIPGIPVKTESCLDYTGTDLDDELVHQRLEQITVITERLRDISQESSFYVDDIKTVLRRIKKEILAMINKIQQSFPDIILWLMHQDRPAAFLRVPVKDIFYSDEVLERGRHCGRVETRFFHEPHKNLDDKRIQAKVDLLLWFGEKSNIGNVLFNAPKEIEEEGDTWPLQVIPYRVFQRFTLRAYIYQGRSLIRKDTNGLADPQAVISIGNKEIKTRVKKETRNPVWKEMLELRDILHWGCLESLKKSPPVIVIDVLDEDINITKRYEFMGRALARPAVWTLGETQKEIFPPDLDWFPLFENGEERGEILAAFELRQVAEDWSLDAASIDGKGDTFLEIPQEIQPKLSQHRVEILIWGVRPKRNYYEFNRPRVEIDYGSSKLEKKVVLNRVKLSKGKKSHNFGHAVLIFDAELPEKPKYKPPLTFLVYDRKNFWDALVGSHVVSSLQDFVVDDKEAKAILSRIPEGSSKAQRVRATRVVSTAQRPEVLLRDRSDGILRKQVIDWWERFNLSLQRSYNGNSYDRGVSSSNSDEEEYDKDISYITIYNTELENQKEFGGFQDFCKTFDLGVGKMTDKGDEYHTIGSLKAAIRVWPMKNGNFPQNTVRGSFYRLPSHHPINIIVRAYCIRAIGLAAADPNGKADPYLIAKFGKERQGDSSDFVAKELSPNFGKVFEFRGTLPFDTKLEIRVMDHDYGSMHDLIGSTSIDIENRFHSRHRATCGLPEKITTFHWRDAESPTEILDKLCQRENLTCTYSQDNGHFKCSVGSLTFENERDGVVNELGSRSSSKEAVALMALRQFHRITNGPLDLVPEHVETRTLYRKDRGNISQGQLQMWVDIFPAELKSIPPPVDISVPKPEEMELRVIVLNTNGIPATESNIVTGLHSSDIYIKGWLQCMEFDRQETDVHYRSVDGHGMFNWRFVFPFHYDKAIRKVVTQKKAHFWEIDKETEVDNPVLHIEVWDADVFSRDDFIGSLTLDLLNLIKPAREFSRDIGRKKGKEDDERTISLFQENHIYGWWKFNSKTTAIKPGEDFVGAVELDLQLINKSSKTYRSVGKARNDPEALPMPKRPSDSMHLFLSPMRVCHLMVCNHKWQCVKFILFFLLVVFIVAFVYALPTHTVDKIL